MDSSFVEYVRDQLQELRGVAARRMFGGYGFYCGAQFFGILHRDRLYFKTDAGTRRAYETRGMSAFRPSAKQTLTNYYEVPADVLDDAGALVEWAQQALRVAPEQSGKRKSSRRARG